MEQLYWQFWCCTPSHRSGAESQEDHRWTASQCSKILLINASTNLRPNIVVHLLLPVSDTNDTLLQNLESASWVASPLCLLSLLILREMSHQSSLLCLCVSVEPIAATKVLPMPQASSFAPLGTHYVEREASPFCSAPSLVTSLSSHLLMPQIEIAVTRVLTLLSPDLAVSTYY